MRAVSRPGKSQQRRLILGAESARAAPLLGNPHSLRAPQTSPRCVRGLSFQLPQARAGQRALAFIAVPFSRVRAISNIRTGPIPGTRPLLRFPSKLILLLDEQERLFANRGSCGTS